MAEALAGALLAASLLSGIGQAGRPIAWCPNPGPQVRFLSCPADEVLYGGAAGGGKSDALLMALLRQVDKPGYVGLYLRREYPAMQEAIERAAELYPVAGGRWSKSERTWRFPSGARILFRHLQHDDTVQSFKSQAFAVIAWDELTTFTEAQYTYLRSRNRTTAPGVRCQIIAATNPDGPGLGWVRSRFIDGLAPNVMHVEVMPNQAKRSRAFIPATLADNPHLGADYEASLLTLGGADQKALLGGDWYAYDGQVFRLERGRNLLTLEDAKAHWAGRSEPPTWWPRYRVLDWGYAKPYACLWVAVDPDGRGWVYRELYGAQKDERGNTKANVGAGHSAGHVGELIASVEHEHGEEMAGSWAGPDLWNEGRGDYGSQKPLVDDFRAAGCRWTGKWNAGRGSRRAKRQRLCALLDSGSQSTLAGIVLVKERCPELVRTLPALQYSSADPEDVDTTAEDHAYDALGGFVMMRSRVGVEEGKPKGVQERFNAGELAAESFLPWEAR